MASAVALGFAGEPSRGPYRSGCARRATGVVVVCLAAYLLGGLAHHRVSTAAEGTATARADAGGAGIDVNGVIDVVSHRVEPVPGQAGVLESVDHRYRAVFDRSGFALDDFGISVMALRRADTVVPLELGPWRGKANVASRQISAGVVERVTARDGEVKWDVVLDHPLPGHGDVIVAARVTGSSGVATQGQHGLVFDADGPDVRVGEVVVEDAHGRVRHRSSPKATGDGLSLVVPARVLAGAAYPLTIDPTVGPEHPASDPLTSNAAGYQDGVALAFDGTNYLAVWTDGRFGTSSYIYGARVSPAGTVLDATGIPISTASDEELGADVAFDGTNFLVVWSSLRSGSSYDIFAARVTKAGAVLDGQGIPVSAGAHDETGPDVAFDGTNYLVVWSDGSVDPRDSVESDVYGVRVSPAGAVLDSPAIPVSTATGNQGSPAAAFDGTNFLVVWQHTEEDSPTDIYGTRVGPAGTVLDSPAFAVSTAESSQGRPAIAFDGTDFLVVWDDSRPGVTRDIYGARVSKGGVTLDPTGIAISTAKDNQYGPSVVFDGSNFFVVWLDNRAGDLARFDIYGARITQAGTLLDATGLPLSVGATINEYPALAFDGTNHLVAWAEYHPDTYKDIYGTRVSRTGTVLDGAGFAVTSSASHQIAPAVAFDGTNYLVVWAEQRPGGDFDIYGARLRRDGVVLDGAGIAISTRSSSQTAPAVAFDGTNFLVVWSDYRHGNSDIYGARLSRDGALLTGPSGIAISTAARDQVDPAIAFDGSRYLVVWTTQLPDFSTDIYGARVNPAGSVRDPEGIPISTAVNSQVSPAVAFDGTRYLVVWSDYRNDGPSLAFADVYGARVSRAGAVVDGAGIAISRAADTQRRPALAFDGTNYLVVWQDHRAGDWERGDIYGSRVTPAGLVKEPAGIAVTAAVGDQSSPQVAFNGRFLVVWCDRRSGGALGDVYGNRVSKAGSTLDGDGFAIAASSTDEQVPAVSADSSSEGRFGIVYQRAATEAPYGANRVFLRTSPK